MSALGASLKIGGLQTITRRLGSARIAFLFLLVLIAPCPKAASAAQFQGNSGQRSNASLVVLDRAIYELRSPSADYGTILQAAVEALPDDASQDTKADIRTFLKRAPRPGAEFRCSADFVRARARLMLRRLREKLLNEAPSALEPAVCYSAPFALSATPHGSADGSLNLYGFDLDAVTPQLILVTSAGFVDVTPALAVRSHFHLTVKLGSAGGVNLLPGSRSLGLAWGHLIRYSVPILRSDARLCSSRIETIPSGKSVTYQLPPSARTVTGSSLNTISADVVLDHSSNKLEATMCVTTANPAVSGCTVAFLYTTDPDRVIDGVLGGGLKGDASSTRGGRPAIRQSSGDPVRQWIFSRPEAGQSAAGDTLVTARLNRIRVVSTEDDGCVAAVAYVEARRTATLDAGIRSVLDQQLRTIDREILQVRPRFAPAVP
jgi:hypothetical protein